MKQKKYEISSINGDVIASCLSLTDACIFIKAQFETYYRDGDLKLTISVMNDEEEKKNDRLKELE